MATLNIAAFFTSSGLPIEGLTPAISIWKVSDSSNIVNESSMNELSGGFYKYSFTSFEPTTDYVFRASGGSTIPTYERFLYSNNESYLDQRLSSIHGDGNWHGGAGVLEFELPFGETDIQTIIDNVNKIKTYAETIMEMVVSESTEKQKITQDELTNLSKSMNKSIDDIKIDLKLMNKDLNINILGDNIEVKKQLSSIRNQIHILSDKWNDLNKNLSLMKDEDMKEMKDDINDIIEMTMEFNIDSLNGNGLSGNVSDVENKE